MTLAAIIVAMFGTLWAGVTWSDATWTPKLALDLEGGTQIILEPVLEEGADEGAITPETITEAINVIRQRVDASGVAEAEITSSGNNIVVGLPGTPDEATLDLVRTSAQMDLRPVLVVGAPTPTATEEPTDGPTATPTDEPTKAAPDSPSDVEYYVTDEVQAEFDALDCTDPANLTGGTPGPEDEAFVTCDTSGTAKYILGPVEVQGSDLASAASGLKTGANNVTTNEWVVDLQFSGDGIGDFRTATERLNTLPSPQNQFAIVLDGLVISAPGLDPGVTITDGRAQISGTFTRESAASLANQLNFGSLPLTFQVQSEEQISATLGSEQLEKGLLAGLLGLVLVVIYSLLQYRALGLVTVASLGMAGIMTYLSITLLSWLQGYRLSLAGVAGLIVAIGITADSFIVYFERIRDELREGRTLVGAVDKGWARAKRTIVASDAVNFLAAVTLYLLAVGGVRGFAFTLGLTTLIDLLLVFMFTHPVMVLLTRTKFFGRGHPMSGLDPRRLGVEGTRYVGRGRLVTQAERDALATTTPEDAEPEVAAPVPVGTRASTATADRPADVLGAADAPRQTIAERRAAARAAERARSGSADGTTQDGPADGPAADDTARGRAEGSES